MTKPTETPMFAADILAFNLDLKKEELDAAKAIESHCINFLAAYGADPYGNSETVTGPGARALKTAAIKRKRASSDAERLRKEIEELYRKYASAMTTF